MTMIPFFIFVRRGLFAAGQVFGISVALISGVLIFILGSGFSVIDFVLSSLGKDPSLTGRDLIWKIAVDAIEARPLLGHGFLAYWMSGESTASYLRYVLKQDLVAFHNVYLEVTVAFGIVGLGIFVLGLIQSLWRGLQFFILNRSVLTVTPFLFIVWISFLSLSENPFFWNSQLHFIFICFAAFSSGSKSIPSLSISGGARSQ
jgi:O-antigen ligase